MNILVRVGPSTIPPKEWASLSNWSRTLSFHYLIQIMDWTGPKFCNCLPLQISRPGPKYMPQTNFFFPKHN